LTLPETRLIKVTATDTAGSPLPVRVQVLADGDTTLPVVPDHFDEPTSTGGRRLHIDFPMDGVTELRAPLGTWRVVVSRGYEYEVYDEPEELTTTGETIEVPVQLEREVGTEDVMCGDFHIHTIRSNDSGDEVERKVRGAVADGLEIPVRSEHEYVESFQPTIEALGLEDHAFSLASVEMTSFVMWGHMGVVPLEPDPAAVNGGAPLWQRYPSADTPDTPVETLDPPEVFADVRARPEEPVVIINHPRGSTNYFDYTGYNRVTGTVDRPEAWDEDFHLVEVFNNSGWFDNLDETVADWLSFLDRGRRVFAVGSSDSHGMRYTPVGYPRTCLEVGTDDPRMLTTHGVRDALAAGNGTISGGIYVDIEVDGEGPGEEATGLGTTAMLSIRVQAASWVDVDAFDVVVDGEIVDTVALDPADSPDGVTRYDGDLEIDVAEDDGYVLVAAYGDMPLDPVHPGKEPFGVTNPVFLSR
ncbi:MAG: CehA/McbA family metallohydrolase, partial [Myxococcota bacterium]